MNEFLFDFPTFNVNLAEPFKRYTKAFTEKILSLQSNWTII